jgi:hypothetical protein
VIVYVSPVSSGSFPNEYPFCANNKQPFGVVLQKKRAISLKANQFAGRMFFMFVRIMFSQVIFSFAPATNHLRME